MWVAALFTFLFLIKQTSAETCVAGKYCSSEWFSSNRCTVCPAGYSCPGQTPSAFGNYCWENDPSKANNAPKSRCSAGKYSGRQWSSCANCAAGKISGSTASYCASCTAGKYSVEASSCKDCEAGKFSTTVRASSFSTCEDCPDGKASEVGATSCQVCAAGLYPVEGEELR